MATPKVLDLNTIRASIEANCDHYGDGRVSIQHDVCCRCHTTLERNAIKLVDEVERLRAENASLQQKLGNVSENVGEPEATRDGLAYSIGDPCPKIIRRPFSTQSLAMYDMPCGIGRPCVVHDTEDWNARKTNR
jgi:hypothetical protein